MSEIIPIAEVIKHKSPKNCWIIIHNDVYNVSRFLSEHPGGEDPILGCAGADATQAFEDVGHSDDARRLLKDYKIGSLSAEESFPHVVPCHSPPRKQKSPPSSPKCQSPVHTIIVPRQRRPRGYPCDKSRWWIYALAALAVAAAGAFAYKKYGGGGGGGA